MGRAHEVEESGGTHVIVSLGFKDYLQSSPRFTSGPNCFVRLIPEFLGIVLGETTETILSCTKIATRTGQLIRQASTRECIGLYNIVELGRSVSDCKVHNVGHGRSGG